MRRLILVAVVGLSACCHTAAVDPPRQDQVAVVRQALGEFVTQVERRDFAAAWRSLSAELRARYTPERLAKDFGLEPLAEERVARLKAGLGAPIAVEQAAATLELGRERIVRLVLERDGWKVAALE